MQLDVQPDNHVDSYPFGSVLADYDYGEPALFVEMPGDSGVGTAADNLDVRVFAGNVGAGKTAYLRRQLAYAKTRNDFFVLEPGGEPPPTILILDATRGLRDPDYAMIDYWRTTWERAILRTLTALLVSTEHLRDATGEEAYGRLTTDYAAILPTVLTPFPINTVLKHILAEHNTGRSLRDYIHNPLWDQLAATLRQILPHCPKLYLHVDAHDTNYYEAPAQWRRCQVGLLHEITRLLTDKGFGSVHIVATVRSLVLADFLSTTAGERYRGHRHIQILDWNDQSTRHLLRTKIANLSANNLIREPTGTPTVEDFVGFDVIKQPQSGTVESVEDYILRHTSYIPRDVVLAGNSLAQQVRTAKRAMSGALPVDSLHEVMGAVARNAGDRRISLVSSHLNAETYQAQVRDARTSLPQTNQSMQGVESALREFIKEVFPKPTFTQADLERANDKAGAYFEGDPSGVLDMLWRGGLIAYHQQRGGDTFSHYYSLSDGDPLSLPRKESKYYLHHSLTHSLDIPPNGAIAPRRE